MTGFGDRVPGESRGDLWWKEAVLYCLDVETFADSDGDGIGDFEGLLSRLGYISALGVDCLWLLPFYPSPNRDDGYDISDFYGVDPRLGTLGDFAEFVHHARKRGIHIIIDLVLNHTSDQHPWFQEACRSRRSPYHDYYVWADEPDHRRGEPAFPGKSGGIWTHVEQVDRYYRHHFYPEQPELDIANPRIQREVRRIMSFWLQLGVEGFRIDSAHYLIDTTGTGGDIANDRHAHLQGLRRFIGRRAGNVVLIGEADVDLQELPTFFGEQGHEELDALFNFRGAAAVFLSLATRSADPVRMHLESRPDVPAAAQWATFLRNHDELNLEHLAQHERQAVFDRFGPEPEHQIFGRGIRRRLATMLDGDQRRLRFALSLLLSLPGIPVLFYGDELGMGDNLDIAGRQAVRVPMQWSSGPSAGFSSAPPEDLVRPLAAAPFGPDEVNVSDQRLDPNSLLNWVARALRVRKESPEVAWGRFHRIETGTGDVLAHATSTEDRVFLAVHNFSTERQVVSLDLDMDVVVEGDLLADQRYDGADLDKLDLDGDGFRWITAIPVEGFAGRTEQDDRDGHPREEHAEDGGQRRGSEGSDVDR